MQDPPLAALVTHVRPANVEGDAAKLADRSKRRDGVAWPTRPVALRLGSGRAAERPCSTATDTPNTGTRTAGSGQPSCDHKINRINY